VGIHLKAKPFGVLCVALPSFYQQGSYDDATSGCLTCCSAFASMSLSQVLPPGSISIHQASNPGFIPPGHGSTSALTILEAASQSQGQHYPGSPSPSLSIAASDTPVSAAPVPTTALSINPGVWCIKSWVTRLLTCNPGPAAAPVHATDTTQDEIVFTSASSSFAGRPAPTCLAHSSHLPIHAVTQPQTVAHAGHWLQHMT
jgi:hypothetical protein